MLHIAVLGSWHVHTEEYARALQSMRDVRVSALWDDDPARGKQRADALHIPFERNLDAILGDPDICGVQVTCATSLHPELLLLAAKHHKHIFTEKVLTIRAGDADRVREAVRLAGVQFAISFPHLCRPQLRAVDTALREGRLGRLTYARVRNVHGGSIQNWLPAHFYDEKETGGGAMIDLGAHPMYTLPHLLGAPKTVQSLFTQVTGRGVEDNAVCLIGFDQGAVGVSETGFVSVNNPYTLEISGTGGCIRVIGETAEIADEKTHSEWVRLPLPEAAPLPVYQWVNAILQGTRVPDMFSIDRAVELTRLMAAAYKAHATGQAQSV